MTRLKSVESGKSIDVAAQSGALCAFGLLSVGERGLGFSSGDVNPAAFRTHTVGDRHGGMGNHAVFLRILAVIYDMLPFMRCDGERRLPRREVCRRLKRNGWIIRPIHILPALSGFALFRGKVGFVRL